MGEKELNDPFWIRDSLLGTHTLLEPDRNFIPGQSAAKGICTAGVSGYRNLCGQLSEVCVLRLLGEKASPVDVLFYQHDLCIGIFILEASNLKLVVLLWCECHQN